jgi:hypothetical protein
MGGGSANRKEKPIGQCHGKEITMWYYKYDNSISIE